MRHRANHAPPPTSGLLALRHRDKAHAHFIGGKSEVGAAQTAKQAVTGPKFGVQLQSPWLRGHPILLTDHCCSFTSERLGPSSLPDHCLGLQEGARCGQEVEASLGPGPYSHQPLDSSRARSVFCRARMICSLGVGWVCLKPFRTVKSDPADSLLSSENWCSSAHEEWICPQFGPVQGRQALDPTHSRSLRAPEGVPSNPVAQLLLVFRSARYPLCRPAD